MLLEDLKISYNTYGKDKGTHTGIIKFTESDMELAIKLTPEHCRKIFQICADALSQVAKDAANKLTSDIITHQKQLEELKDE